MSIDAMKQALEALKIGQDVFSQAFSGYGYYRPDNPHNFFPDPECCTPKEIAYHSAACEAYDKGTYVPDHSDGWITPELHVTKAPWGIGTYTDECKEITDAITSLRAAIEAAERVEPVGYVRAYALEHLSKPGHTVINHEPLSDDDIALYTSTQPATDAYELGKKDGWEACEACHGIVNGVIQQPAIPEGWQLVPVEPTGGDEFIQKYGSSLADIGAYLQSHARCRAEGAEMSRTEELLALAEASIKERPARNRLYKLQDAANPETIKQLVELCRVQHEALKWAEEVDSAYDGEPADELTEAIAAFNKFEGGK